MSFREESTRIFVGGLSWNTTERQLEHAFSPYGKILETQVMLDRDTGRPRGFGFITFEDPRDMEDAIKNMDGREIDGRIVSVNQAQPKMGKLEPSYGHRGASIPSGGRGNFGGGGGDRSITRTECFKCGRPGHWARECRSGGGPIPHRPKFDGDRGGREDHFGGDRYGDNMDDRYDNGRYGDRDRMDNRDRSNAFGGGSRYGGRESRYYDEHDRYPSEGGERFSGDRYDSSDRYPQNGYGKDRGFDQEGGARGNNARYGSSNDRYGAGGPISGGGRGNYRVRPGPYDRPVRGNRPSYDDRF